MNNYVQEGDVLDLIAPYTVAAGAGFLVGALFAVATSAAASGTAVRGKTKGVFNSMAKATGTAWTVGEVLYWDDSAKNLTTTSNSGANVKVGCASAAALSGDTTGSARLNGTV